MTVVNTITSATALPRPDAVLYSEETEINEHIPRKFDNTMLLEKIEARKITTGLMAGALPILTTSNSLFTSSNVVHDPNHDTHQEERCRGHHHNCPGFEFEEVDVVP